jgi:hypothetical protein
MSRSDGGKLEKDLAQPGRERSEATLVAMKECKSYLEKMEKDLSQLSKKFSNREIAQTVGLAATGIHEALHYLEIVRKVIEKTERALANRSNRSDDSTLPTGETLI